jgi:hypothetical protein
MTLLAISGAVARKLLDRPHDTHPDDEPIQLTSCQEFVSALGSDDQGIIAMLAEQHICRSPYV